MGMGFTDDNFSREIARGEIILNQYKVFGSYSVFEIEELSYVIKEAKKVQNGDSHIQKCKIYNELKGFQPIFNPRSRNGLQ